MVMKKYLFLSAIIVALASCNDGSNGEANDSSADGTDTHSAATDSTQTPNGVTTGSVISTNPDATKTDSAQRNDDK